MYQLGVSKSAFLAFLVAGSMFAVSSISAAKVKSQSTYRYVKDLTKEMEENFSVPVMNYFRSRFPEVFSAPRWNDFLEHKLAEGVTDIDEIRELYLLILGGERLSEQETLALISENSVLRANFLAYLVVSEQIASDSQFSTEVKQLGILNASRLITPLIMAIDRDISLLDIIEEASDLAAYGFGLYYRNEAISEELIANSPCCRHVGSYLLRTNHIQNKQLSREHIEKLQQRGYTDPELHDMIPSNLVTALVDDKSLPIDTSTGKARIGVTDLAVAIDLMSERGIVMPVAGSALYFANSYGGRVGFDQESQNILLNLLATEIGTDAVNAKFYHKLAEIESIVSDPSRPASLLQVVQLLRLGFSLEEIRAFSYLARDAIIVSNPVDRKDFIAKATWELGASKFDIDEVNEFTAKLGVLVFRLLIEGYRLKEISRHHRGDYLPYLLE